MHFPGAVGRLNALSAANTAAMVLGLVVTAIPAHAETGLPMTHLKGSAAVSAKVDSATTGYTDDPFLWLEEVEGERALDWVKTQSDGTLGKLSADARFATLERNARQILEASDRIPIATLGGDMVYNYWQDATNVRGVWRRMPLANYGRAGAAWETLLDLDALARAENENWVWQSAVCLAPDYQRCLIRLSRGGKDAAVVREFDLTTRSFVANGFNLPEAKQNTTWIDRDRLMIGRDFGEGTMTSSGYPATARIWRRGTDVSTAVEVFRGAVTDVSVSTLRLDSVQGPVLAVCRNRTFWTTECHVLTNGGSLVPVRIPDTAELRAVLDGRLIVRLQAELRIDEVVIPAGSVISTPMMGVTAASDVEVVARASREFAIQGARVTGGKILLDVLTNVQSRLVVAERVAGGSWTLRDVPVPPLGAGTIVGADYENSQVLWYFQSFIVPPAIFAVDVAGAGAPRMLISQPARFDATGLKAEQRFATSADGTRIPYFIVGTERALAASNKDSGGAATLLYGYGGFRISLQPAYLATLGGPWLRSGGVYVVANIRGGGEFGPDWHAAATLHKKQRSYDDFIAVAEDLIERGITSPKRLGIQGGSNGGLLVGAVTMQRPDLFNAVLCQVPLLDMLRYHLLLAGASWMGEYGNPDNADDRNYILTYSPYQRIVARSGGGHYPPVFFYTSTKDDRVHPGHARKMAARMAASGHDIYYYENMEGGHGGSANLAQRARKAAMEMVYLYQRLMDGSAQ